MRTTPFKFETMELTPLQRLAQDMIAGRTELTPEEQTMVAQHGTDALKNEMIKIKGLPEEKPEAKPETAAPDKPKNKKTLWEQYQLIIILVAVIAIVVFFWKFKIVSKAAAAITA